MHYPVLDVGNKRVPLGRVSGPGDLPELLRHVADYYDDNPDECAQLLGEFSLPRRAVTDPFAGGGLIPESS